jgi:hypothetical protein
MFNSISRGEFFTGTTFVLICYYLFVDLYILNVSY